MHIKDKALLEEIINYFKAGKIFKHTSETIRYVASSVEDLKIIIKHFDQYPLHTKNFADYELFKESFFILKNKEHLTMEGLTKIVSIKALFPRGLSVQLKAAFPAAAAPILPSPKANIKNTINPYWLAGFTSAEGCFFVDIQKATTNIGKTACLKFQITQHSRDTLLLTSLIDYLGCGRYSKLGNRLAGDFIVTRFKDISGVIIPFFEKYLIKGSKQKDFKDFKEVALLISNKAHLTSQGLEKICKIKVGMNKGRSKSS